MRIWFHPCSILPVVLVMGNDGVPGVPEAHLPLTVVPEQVNRLEAVHVWRRPNQFPFLFIHVSFHVLEECVEMVDLQVCPMTSATSSLLTHWPHLEFDRKYFARSGTVPRSCARQSCIYFPSPSFPGRGTLMDHGRWTLRRTSVGIPSLHCACGGMSRCRA